MYKNEIQTKKNCSVNMKESSNVVLFCLKRKRKKMVPFYVFCENVERGTLNTFPAKTKVS